ncbi:hypothetical protein PHYSODRAFT_318690 [Phytophthora sojae]|uniref:SCP domain-containing protein n=1 Tax=Phytophthora sojae (strain P6497) TaxID=1094619 RepID=G5A5Y1_PHYSP|nr:hypothetical protein PHYSODRAFT_318690 [Phytophthora sojae]EGZ08736.1 hypothetical protein PHYSODRAFT_318690 [Phytophthora sojae]|eukprot:XP_009535369.1 hypothetical protein PHYSODRAFT_318690 [Phytophthora sojae]
MVATLLKTAAVAAAVLAATTEAHNKMTLPLPTWPDGFYNQNSPSGTIDPTNVLPVPSGMSYNTDPASNTKAYWTAFNASKYTSLKELAWDTQTLADSASNECGFSLIDGRRRRKGGDIEDWNAAVDYPDTPANLPYDNSKCEGAAVLTSYWIALHTTPWQVYTNCAPLTGASASSNSSTAESTTKTPAVTTATPTAATKTTAPTATTATPTEDTTTQTTASTEASAEDESETGDEASTDEEAAETEAPATTTAPSTDKCSVRRRRH